MPGPGNTPQAMLFETTNQPATGVVTPVNWLRAEGIPISPYDDAHHKNPYPLMRLIARNSSGTAIARNDVVLPVSDEMDCRACHASGTQAAAQARGRLGLGRLAGTRLPAEHPAPARRTPVRQPSSALRRRARGARLQSPRALPRRGGGRQTGAVRRLPCLRGAWAHPSYGNIPPLTTSVHAFHAHVEDPVLKTHARQLDQPRRLLPLPPRLDHQVPARRHGRRDRGRRLDGNAVPKLPWQHERRRFGQPRRLVHGTELPELPYRHGHATTADPLHVRL